MDIKEKFENLKVYQKLELYIIITIIYFIIWYLYEPKVIKTDSKNPNTFLSENYKNKISHIKNSFLKKEDKEIVFLLYELSDRFNCNLKNLKIDKNIVSMELESKFINIFNFLINLNEHFNIKYLRLKKADKTVLLKIDFSKKYFYKSDQSHSYNNLPNPFNYNETLTKNTKSELVLKAIVSNNIFLNGKWYKKGDRVGEYKVISIKDEYVVLFNDKSDKKLFLKVFKDEE